MSASSFRDLRVWQEAMRVTTEIYRSTSSFPETRIIRTESADSAPAVSVPSNIAEGKGHRSDKQFVHFLLHARGSLLELQTQLLIAEELQYIGKEEARRLLGLADGVGRSL